MINVDPSSHSPTFIQGIWGCNRNPAETRSLFGVPILCALSTDSSPWGRAKHSHPAEPPQKRAVVPAGAICLSSFPGSSLVPPLKINSWRGCLRNRWKSLKVRCQKPLQCSSVPPADKILENTWNKRLHKGPTHMFSEEFCWNSWRHFLLCTPSCLHCSSAGGCW